MKLKIKGAFFLYKNTFYKSKIKRILFILVSTILTAFLILSLSSCCIDYSEFIKSGSEKITFEGDEEDLAKLGELLKEYNINPEDFTRSTDNQSQDIDYTEVKKELADASGYPVTPEEEKQFFGSLKKIYSEERFIEVGDFFEDFKHLYPSGYFTMIKVTQKQDYTAGYGWFELLNDSNSFNLEGLEGFEDFDLSALTPDFYEKYTDDIIVIVHELTHCGSGPFIYLFVEDLRDYPGGTYYSYMVGNLLVFIEKDKMFFSKYELLQDIKNPNTYDKIYLDPDEALNIIGSEGRKVSDIDFTMILDELNAYTVSVKCAIACEEFLKYSSGIRLGLLKQMSHFELYLKRCYEKYPEDWKSITGNKGLAFLIMKLWLEAEKYEDAVKDDMRFNMRSEPVSEFVYHPDNYGIIEKFFNDSNILDYRNKTFQEAGEELDGIKVYNINS